MRGLAVVAAVGPIVAAELDVIGVQVNVTPRDNTFFMKPLVRELAAALMKNQSATHQGDAKLSKPRAESRRSS